MIRLAEPHDAEAICRLLAKAITGSAVQQSTQLAQQLSRTTALMLVDTEQERVVGTIVGQIVHDEAEIHDVAIEQRFRRQGRAKQLVRSFEEHAALRGAQQSFLEVRASNSPAIHLYETLGYGTRGNRRGYYSDGEDAIVMNKTLGQTA